MRIVDNNGKQYRITPYENRIVLDKGDVQEGTEFIEFQFDEWAMPVGSNGYYIIADYEKLGSYLCYFTEKEEKDFVVRQNMMPIFGVKNDKSCFLVVVQGMRRSFYLHVGLHDGCYHIGARFVLNGDAPYEDMSFRVFDLGEKADYSDLAVAYRNYQLENGGCRPLAQRAENNPYLQYAAESVQIRIRMGWKPAPPTVMEQTRENEPEMQVACTFDRVKDVVDELERQGIDKAELCLVGWNKSGHDGRWPEMFPVEEKLGGEEALKSLIAYAQEKGYQITCHTNSTSCYHIAQDFSEEIVEKDKNGTLVVDEYAWSGGRMYHLCPVKALAFAERDLPKTADLGFRGIHYIDVISVVPLIKCYDPRHPVNEAQTEEIYRKIGNYSKELFGGFSSEGAFDFAADYLDYALYVTFASNQEPFFDQEIPLWQIVYHGIILSNPSTETVNYPIKPRERALKVMEYGGRPTFYFYSKFMSNYILTDWLGREDIGCQTDEELREAVNAIRIAYEEYKRNRHLQYAFIAKHTKLAEGVFEVTYSDGTVVNVDYTTGKYTVLEK